MGIKCIFLDIDGVMNTDRSEKWSIESELMELLAEIVLATGAKIVLSSAWRFSSQRVAFLREEFKRVHIEDQFIGSTEPLDIIRTEEIKSWLERARLAGMKIESWIAIDDMDLLSYDPKLMAGNFLITDSRVGLTRYHVELGIRMLGRIGDTRSKLTRLWCLEDPRRKNWLLNKRCNSSQKQSSRMGGSLGASKSPGALDTYPRA